jgi:hypothetical protein
MATFIKTSGVGTLVKFNRFTNLQLCIPFARQHKSNVYRSNKIQNTQSKYKNKHQKIIGSSGCVDNHENTKIKYIFPDIPIIDNAKEAIIKNDKTGILNTVIHTDIYNHECHSKNHLETQKQTYMTTLDPLHKFEYDPNLTTQSYILCACFLSFIIIMENISIIIMLSA